MSEITYYCIPACESPQKEFFKTLPVVFEVKTRTYQLTLRLISQRYVDTVEGACNGFLPYTRFLGFLEFSGYHQWQQESQ